MDHIWAPWRMPFIEGSGGREGCFLCSHAAEDRDEDNYIVHRAARCYVLLNLYPYNSGHLMVVPYQHTGSLPELDMETGSDLFATAQLSLQVLTEVMHPDGFNLGINQGAISGAGVADHIHLHIVPRWAGDTNFMPVLADTKVMPELLTSTAAKLRPIFGELTRQP
jgi:ATP adenylyltransferase